MLAPSIGGGLQQTTNYKVVVPFYVYAAISFLVATVLLLCHTDIVELHYFQPYTLAITHTMALGWATMIILGASHQLLPVLVEGKLDSNLLAYLTFAATAIGIPFLVIGFYIFHVGWVLQTGAVLINIGVVFYLLNVFESSLKSKQRNVHTWYILTAALWLFSTTFLGLLLVFNFTHHLLAKDSLAYLSIHAHLGIAGWFLLLVIGVGSRLIPMFLISKYNNNQLLWWIYGLVNMGLVSFLLFKVLDFPAVYFYGSIAIAFSGIVLFGIHCIKAYRVRIRKNVDEQMKTSLLSVLQMLLPFVALIATLLILPAEKYPRMALLYGFCIFFGWLTAIILGMTFKTLPFIVWNKVYHKKAHAGKTPAPKELFSEKIYRAMLHCYLSGFVLFALGIILFNTVVLKLGAAALVAAAALYVLNIGKIILHQPKKL